MGEDWKKRETARLAEILATISPEFSEELRRKHLNTLRSAASAIVRRALALRDENTPDAFAAKLCSRAGRAVRRAAYVAKQYGAEAVPSYDPRAYSLRLVWPENGPWNTFGGPENGFGVPSFPKG